MSDETKRPDRVLVVARDPAQPIVAADRPKAARANATLTPTQLLYSSSPRDDGPSIGSGYSDPPIVRIWPDDPFAAGDPPMSQLSELSNEIQDRIRSHCDRDPSPEEWRRFGEDYRGMHPLQRLAAGIPVPSELIPTLAEIAETRRSFGGPEIKPDPGFRSAEFAVIDLLCGVISDEPEVEAEPPRQEQGPEVPKPIKFREFF